MGLPKLTIAGLRKEAAAFAAVESKCPEPSLYGVTDGKAVGTYVEHKFRAYLEARYAFTPAAQHPALISRTSEAT